MGGYAVDWIEEERELNGWGNEMLIWRAKEREDTSLRRIASCISIGKGLAFANATASYRAYTKPITYTSTHSATDGFPNATELSPMVKMKS